MKDAFKYFDKIAFAALICLTICGIILIYSASTEMGKAFQLYGPILCNIGHYPGYSNPGR